MSDDKAQCPHHKGGDTSACPATKAMPDNKQREFNEAIGDFRYDRSDEQNFRASLSNQRSKSSILKSDYTPSHQPGDEKVWVYPSEQQYFNAMKRKGYNPQESDVPVILTIHNMVNEQGWSKIREWELYSGNSEPKLKKFMGRPQDISPKARILNFLGYSLPFDRHDWIVDRNGEDVRYVIDFYRGAAKHSPISIYLDVRPAIDNVPSLFNIVSFQLRRIFSIGSIPETCLQSDSWFQRYMSKGSKKP
jgi:cytochrome c heme-lyase